MSPRAHFWLRFAGLAIIVAAQLAPRVRAAARSERASRPARGDERLALTTRPPALLSA